MLGMEFVIDAFLVCIAGLHILWPPLSAPCSMGEPRLPVPLPSHYHHRRRGAARALRGEAAGSGHNAVAACNDTQVYG